VIPTGNLLDFFRISAPVGTDGLTDMAWIQKTLARDDVIA